MTSFVETYVDGVAEQLRALSPEAVAPIADRFLATADAGAQIFVAGNGGSASTASHFACDLGKTALGSNPERRTSRFRAISLVDNVALLTAWANDTSYDRVFAEPIRMLARPDDLLCIVSVSGNSPNAVAAVAAARELGVYTVGLLGRDGGRLKDDVDDYLLVASHDYGFVESVHLVIAHLLTQWLKDRLDERGG